MISMPQLTEEGYQAYQQEKIKELLEKKSREDYVLKDDLLKKSNLRFKLDALPNQIREYFFQEVTISKVLDALREVKNIDETTPIIKYTFSIPVVDILPNDEEREHDSFSVKTMFLNYYECIDLLELMITYVSDDDESNYQVE